MERLSAVAALAALALVGTVLCLHVASDPVMEDVKEAAAAPTGKLSWKDLGVPDMPEDHTEKDDPADEFIAEMSADLADSAVDVEESDCLIQKDGYNVGASGKVCCDQRLSTSSVKCLAAQKGCAVARMAKMRESFNTCATAAERDCDSQAEAYRLFLQERAQSVHDHASKKKQLKSMAAAASTSSELMFAAMAAVSTDKDKASAESTVKTPVATSEAETALKTHIGMQQQCMEQKVALCHSRVKGAKVRSLALCKAKHAAKATSCRSAAKAVHAKCVAADVTADYFPQY